MQTVIINKWATTSGSGSSRGCLQSPGRQIATYLTVTLKD